MRSRWIAARQIGIRKYRDIAKNKAAQLEEIIAIAETKTTCKTHLRVFKAALHVRDDIPIAVSRMEIFSRL